MNSLAVMAGLLAVVPVSPADGPAPAPEAVGLLALAAPEPSPSPPEPSPHPQVALVSHPAVDDPPVPPDPPPARTEVSPAELECLALNIYWEARGESEEGQRAVAHVTLNRAGAAGFPSTLCGVVAQGGRNGPCQFGWYCDGRSDRPDDPRAWEQAQAVARKVIAGDDSDPTGGALYFLAPHQFPDWAAGRMRNRTVIGAHVFFTLGPPVQRVASLSRSGRRGDAGPEQAASDWGGMAGD